MTYYKVVRNDLTSWADLKELSVLYKIGKFVTPKLENSKLFVFDDLYIAKSFCHISNKLYECEVKNPKKYKQPHIAKIYVNDNIDSFINNAKNMWKLRHQKRKFSNFIVSWANKDHNSYSYKYDFVVECDAVKLTNRIM